MAIRPARRRLDASGLPLLGAGRLHRTERAEDPLQAGGHLPDSRLGTLGGLPDLRNHQRGTHTDDRDHAKRDAQQDGIEERHHHDRRDQGHRPRRRGDHRLGADRPQQRGVGGHPGHQIARLHPVHLRKAQPQQPSDEAAAGGEHHQLSRPFQHMGTERLGRRAQQHQHGRCRQDVSDGATGREPVDQCLRGQRLQQPGDHRIPFLRGRPRTASAAATALRRAPAQWTSEAARVARMCTPAS